MALVILASPGHVAFVGIILYEENDVVRRNIWRLVAPRYVH